MTVSCVGTFNRITVHSVPAGHSVGAQSPVADVRVTTFGIEYTTATADLVLAFTPLGESLPTYTVALPGNCWEDPEALPLGPDRYKAEAVPEPQNYKPALVRATWLPRAV